MLAYKTWAVIHIGGILLAAAADPTSPLSWIGTLGSASAAVVITYLFLQDKKEDRKVRKEEQAQFVSALAAQQEQERTERHAERERSEKQRKEFSDVLKHYREESTKAAQHGSEGLKQVVGTVTEIKDLAATMKMSQEELVKFIERASEKLDDT